MYTSNAIVCISKIDPMDTMWSLCIEHATLARHNSRNFYSTTMMHVQKGIPKYAYAYDS